MRFRTQDRLLRALPVTVAQRLRLMRSFVTRRLDDETRSDVYDRVWPHLNMIDVQFDWLAKQRLVEGAASLFSIGPGNGALELRLVEEFGLELGYAEPSASSRAALESTAEGAGVMSRIVERQAAPFLPAEITRRYDLILSSASWYGIGFERTLLDQTLSLLSEGGTLIISLTSRKDFFVEEGIRKAVAMTAEDIAEWLTDEGVPYELDFVTRQLPMNLLVEHGQPTQLAKEATAFFNVRPWTSPRSGRARWQSVLQTHSGGQFSRVRGILTLRNEPAASARFGRGNT